MPGGVDVTGTREGRPLCDEIITPAGGLCDNSIWREGKCALHWNNSAAVRRPDVRSRADRRRRALAQEARPPGSTREVRVERVADGVQYFRGGRPIEQPLTGMEAVWEACRRWDRLYDATLRRQDGQEGRAST